MRLESAAAADLKIISLDRQKPDQSRCLGTLAQAATEDFIAITSVVTALA